MIHRSRCKVCVVITGVIYLTVLFFAHACLRQKRLGSSQIKKACKIKVENIYTSKDSLFLQARSAIIPHETDTGFLVTQSIYGYGTHSYGDLYVLKKSTCSKNWIRPTKIEELTRRSVSNELVKSFGDVTPVWHNNTQTVLCTGKSSFAKSIDTNNPVGTRKRVDIETMKEVAYAIYYPGEDKWSQFKKVILPVKLENGDDFVEANAGCTQRVDLPDGDVLLPIRYKNNVYYVSTVIKCFYDGNELKYKNHGSLLSINQGRGLYEPCYANTGIRII